MYFSFVFFYCFLPYFYKRYYFLQLIHVARIQDLLEQSYEQKFILGHVVLVLLNKLLFPFAQRSHLCKKCFPKIEYTHLSCSFFFNNQTSI